MITSPPPPRGLPPESAAGSASDVLRQTPRQSRGHVRVDQIMDAAAELVDTIGLGTLSMTAVATQAGTSIGTVYRYFPDVDALIVALGRRNFAALRRLFASATTRPADDWQTAFTRMFQALVTAYRSVPSFRLLRSSGWLLADPLPPDEGPPPTASELREQTILRHAVLVEDAIAGLGGQRRIRLAEDPRFALAMAFSVVDAIVLYAFQRDRGGNPELLKTALRFGLIQARPAFVVED